MLKPSLQLKLGQQLTMTPQLQQAIRLLQLPALELQAPIRAPPETNGRPHPTAAARAIVDASGDDGYLTASLAEIAQTLRPELECSAQEVQRVLMRVQALDPSGVGARSVAECIELQLRQLDPETPGLATALEIARAHLELLAGREFTLLRPELRRSAEG